MDLQKFWTDLANNSYFLALLTIIAFALVFNMGGKKRNLNKK